MSDYVLSIGLITDTATQLAALQAVIENSGYQVSSSRIISAFHEELVNEELSEKKRKVDAWVVCVDSDKVQADLVDDWLESVNVPVIFCDIDVPEKHHEEYSAWSRRLTKKLLLLSGSINLSKTKEGSAKEIWVLAASTGGPGAVKKFMSALPENLNVGFIYVQHIDKGFDDTLAKAMSGSSRYPAKLISHGDVIKNNELSIIPPDKATEIIANGTFIVKNHPWSTAYSPSVDSIVADVAYHFGENSGVIVFSGMGNDGAIGGKIMQRHGGKLWVQSLKSCTITSMPEAVIETGGVDFTGTPEELAEAFIKLSKEKAYYVRHKHYVEQYKLRAIGNTSE
ncbi:MAG: chemotaxis protein CheB [Cellvibrionaceae bacterium]